MQNVVCKFEKCGSRSKSGFCLNRMVVITEQGQCERLLRQGWDKPIEKEFSSNYNYWLAKEEEQRAREPVQIPAQISDNEKQDQTNPGKDGPPRD